MPRSPDASASDLRQMHLDARRRMSPAERDAASDSICRELVRSRLFAGAGAIGAYLAMSDEVDLDGFVQRAWARKKRIYAPRVADNHEMVFRELSPGSRISRNQYGIWEALDGDDVLPRELDWIILPMVVFDNHGHRIGMGGGYYDRALRFARHRHRVFKPQLSGVAFACQQTARIDPNPWDIGVSRVYSA